MSRQAQKQKQQAPQDDDQQLLALLKESPDILLRHPSVLAELEIPHESGTAVSLIERQVRVLRDKVQVSEERLMRLMDIARDNERLAASCHRLAVNLLGADDLDDVVSIVLAELRNELGADFAVMRLITEDQNKLSTKPELFVDSTSEPLKSFDTMLNNRKPLCGQCTSEQKAFLFGDDIDQIGSAAVIPLVAGARLGLVGLGAKDKNRFNIAMGTEFLGQIGELISTALAIHLARIHPDNAK